MRAAGKEHDVVPGGFEPRAEIAADGPRRHHRDAHGRCVRGPGDDSAGLATLPLSGARAELRPRAVACRSLHLPLSGRAIAYDTTFRFVIPAEAPSGARAGTQ